MTQDDPGHHEDSQAIKDVEFPVLDRLVRPSEDLLKVPRQGKRVKEQGPTLLPLLDEYLLRVVLIYGLNQRVLRVELIPERRILHDLPDHSQQYKHYDHREPSVKRPPYFLPGLVLSASRKPVDRGFWVLHQPRGLQPLLINIVQELKLLLAITLLGDAKAKLDFPLCEPDVPTRRVLLLPHDHCRVG